MLGPCRLVSTNGSHNHELYFILVSILNTFLWISRLRACDAHFFSLKKKKLYKYILRKKKITKTI